MSTARRPDRRAGQRPERDTPRAASTSRAMDSLARGVVTHDTAALHEALAARGEVTPRAVTMVFHGIVSAAASATLRPPYRAKARESSPALGAESTPARSTNGESAPRPAEISPALGAGSTPDRSTNGESAPRGRSIVRAHARVVSLVDPRRHRVLVGVVRPDRVVIPRLVTACDLVLVVDGALAPVSEALVDDPAYPIGRAR